MKKSDLKKIIREEIVEVLRGQLNEAFGDPIAAKLSKFCYFWIYSRRMEAKRL